MDAVRSIFASDDVRGIALVAGAAFVGFGMSGPSPATIRALVSAIAAGALAFVVVRGHAVAEDGVRTDSDTVEGLYGRIPASGTSSASASVRSKVPVAMLVHPDVTKVIASLAPLSRPGRRGAVRSVAVATEAVMRSFNAAMLTGEGGQGTEGVSAFIDDLRDRTVRALDALQDLHMQSGSRSRAAEIVRDADLALRSIFARLRQVASNKNGCGAAPYPHDPTDDPHLVR